MTPKRLTAVLTISLALSAAACTGQRMQRLDPSADDNLGGTMIASSDVIAATDRAVADLSQALLRSPKDKVVVAPATIKNETIQPFDTALLSDRMINSLVRGTGPRITYLAREHVDEVTREREAKRAGVYSGGERKQMLGADYLLTGRIISLTKLAGADRADYFQLGFRLVDAEDGHIVWSDMYEFKKAGQAGVIYQ